MILVITALALACFLLGVACIMLAWLVRELHSDLNMFAEPLVRVLKMPPDDAERLRPGHLG